MTTPEETTDSGSMLDDSITQIKIQFRERQTHLALPIPQNLYHYTNTYGFMGIVKTSRLWAHDIRFSNDPSELSYSHKLLTKTITDICRGTADQDEKELLRRITEASDLRDYWAVYSVSFSEYNDDLSQWRAYAQGVGGFSVGFELNRQHPMRSIFEGKEGSDPWMLFKVVYDRNTQRESFEYIVKGILGIYRSERRNIQKHLLDNLINKLCRDTRLLLADCLLSFKNPAFRNENEWRLVFLGDKADRSDPLVVHYRDTRFGLTPYVKYKTPTPGNLLPIGVVIQGSRVDPELSAEAVQGYLIRYGYTYAKVSRTAVPLR